MVKTAKLRLENMPESNMKTTLMDVMKEADKPRIPFEKRDVKYIKDKKYGVKK